MAALNENIFTNLLTQLSKEDIKHNSIQSRKWFAEKIRGMRKNNRMDDKKFIASLNDRFVRNIVIGKMYMFYYDAKHKDKLPFFDRFPLIFPIERYNNGFLGINFHYLQPALRAKLLDALMLLANNKRYDETTKLKISYMILKRATKSSLFAPCIKRYLYSQLRSHFIPIHSNEWQIAIYLPLEKFTINKANVYRASNYKNK